VPGQVDSPLSQGTNELIREGAVLVQDLDDILKDLGDVGSKMSPPEKPEQEVVPPNLSVPEQKLLSALTGGPLSVDELVRKTTLDSGLVISNLTMLVLKGAIQQRPGNVFARRKAKQQ
jgi:DNA processing protein